MVKRKDMVILDDWYEIVVCFKGNFMEKLGNVGHLM